MQYEVICNEGLKDRVINKKLVPEFNKLQLKRRFLKEGCRKKKMKVGKGNNTKI